LTDQNSFKIREESFEPMLEKQVFGVACNQKVCKDCDLIVVFPDGGHYKVEINKV